ncbi:hypothetical protein SynRS9915_01313 [Synechococcus sp. RS9915]|nr:hypothetical protein SynRS9915_01313 [Synechococcus sp. RS9915]
MTLACRGASFSHDRLGLRHHCSLDALVVVLQNDELPCAQEKLAVSAPVESCG